MRLPKVREIRGFLAECCRQAFEKPLYSFGIEAYSVGVRVAGMKNAKAHKLACGQREIWKRLDEKIKPGDRYIWVHAASLGEFEQGRPLIEKIKREHPEFKVLLTFFSPSGYEVRKDYPEADCVVYLPFDTPGRVRKFLYKVNPEIAVFVKYEFWRNYLEELWRRQIPTYLICGAFRKDQFFFKKRSAWYGYWLKWYTKIFVQDESSRELLKKIHVDNVEVCGDTRFDRVAEIAAQRKPIPEIAAFTRQGEQSRPVTFMAGSSWQPDEDIYIPWLDRHPEIKVVVAPHEFDDTRLAELKARFKNGAVLLSELKKDPSLADGKQALIIDCFGILSSAYQYCDIAYIGGGFGTGIHNINEAAVYGVPVIFGPKFSKFIEARELTALGGAIAIDGDESFDRTMTRLCDPGERKRTGEISLRYIKSKLGATPRIVEEIFKKGVISGKK